MVSLIGDVSDLLVDFRGEMTRAAGIFPSRTDSCLNLLTRHRRGGQRSDRHGAIERHPTLALPGPFLDPRDFPAHRTFAKLAEVITRIVAGHSQSRIDELLPWVFGKTVAEAVA
ncbi:transposase domain-containing protein [Prosthecomicrobium hirschii]|nr:transposase domain-containing protein [Prosthecomicrobium hirschii]MCW1842242.1 transposase domain-containing protein [Prosthecomicrobium hirschii]